MSRIPTSAAATMRNQHALITRRQALDHGMTSRQIERLTATGGWEQVHPGVYRSAEAPVTRSQQLLAPCLITGDGVLSHRTAAGLWGVRDLRGRTDAVIDVTVGRERLWHLPAVALHRSRDLTPDQVGSIDSLPVTTPTRTLVDLGQVTTWREVQRAFDTLRLAGHVTFESTRAALALHSKKGRRGCGALRRVITEWGPLDAPVESVLEAAFLRLCADHGIPLPECQVEVRVGGRVRRLDFAYPELRIAIELDGYAVHSLQDRYEDDRARRNALTLAGWTVLQFTWRRVVHQPAGVAFELRNALGLA